jgi:hypothetical protein
VVRHVLAVELYEHQARIVAAVEANPRVAVRAAQAVGKSYASAALVVAFMLSRDGALVISSAPTARQMSAILWREIHDIYRASRLPLGGTLLQTEWRLDNRLALGFVSNVGTDSQMAVKFQGLHGAGSVLIVVDEASGIDRNAMDSLRGSLTNQDSHLLLIGNPGETSGLLYDAFHSLRHLYVGLHVSYKDVAPNFYADGRPREVPSAPFLTGPEFVEQAKAEWGESGANYQVRVLGEFPSQASDSIIAVQWAEEAVKRPAPVDMPRRVYECGVDPARFGSDQTAVCIRSNDEVILVEAWSKYDTVASAERVAELAREHRVTVIRVDTVGVGGGVYDHLRLLSDAGKLPTACRLVEYNAAAKPRDPEHYKMKRDSDWAALRDRFREGRICALPNNQKLLSQLVSVRFSFDSAGRMCAESKDSLKKRGISSPDLAESVLLAFSPERPVGEGASFDRLMEDAIGGTVLPNFMDKVF